MTRNAGDAVHRRFIITIDTEGDDAWSAPQVPSTRNARHVPRFQELCERHGFAPTYLTTWEMVNDGFFADFGRDVLARGTGEIGMHLHAWHQPPFDVTLTREDWRDLPYLKDYPEHAMREKVKTMTARLEDVFDVEIRSHRAGRWAIDGRYVRILADEGYEVDCSVTPLVSWANHPGAPGGSGGADYRHFPAQPYLLDDSDLATAAEKGALVEVPMTIVAGSCPAPVRPLRARLAAASPAGRVVRRLWPEALWLRPTGRNLGRMLGLVRELGADARCEHLEFMLHSSELMPGASPTFPDERSIERLYEDLEVLFAEVARVATGATLTGYARAWRSRP